MTTLSKGYELSIDKDRSVLQMRLWGFWDPEVSQNFLQDFQAKVTEIERQRPWYVLVDMTEFPPQSDPVQRTLKEAMQFAKTHQMKKAARVVSSTITKMQFSRLSEEMRIPEHSFFHTSEEALAWLMAP